MADPNGLPFPAVCTACGYVFPCANLIRANPGVQIGKIHVANVTVGCPRCSGLARVVEGDYSFVDGALKLLKDAPTDALQVLREVLSECPDISDELLGKEVAQRAPRLLPLLEFVRSQSNRMEGETLALILIGLITIVLMLRAS